MAADYQVQPGIFQSVFTKSIFWVIISRIITKVKPLGIFKWLNQNPLICSELRAKKHTHMQQNVYHEWGGCIFGWTQQGSLPLLVFCLTPFGKLPCLIVFPEVPLEQVQHRAAWWFLITIRCLSLIRFWCLSPETMLWHHNTGLYSLCWSIYNDTIELCGITTLSGVF